MYAAGPVVCVLVVVRSRQLHGHRAELLRDPPTLQGGKNHGTVDLYDHTRKPGLIPGGLKSR